MICRDHNITTKHCDNRSCGLGSGHMFFSPVAICILKHIDINTIGH